MKNKEFEALIARAFDRIERLEKIAELSPSTIKQDIELLAEKAYEKYLKSTKDIFIQRKITSNATNVLKNVPLKEHDIKEKIAELSRTEIVIPPENIVIEDTRIDIPPIYLTNTNTRLYIKSPVAKESITIEDILDSSFTNPSTRLHIKEKEKVSFLQELEILINKHSMENGSDTPDYILARYLNASLTAWNVACNEREKWYFDKQDKQNKQNANCKKEKES